MRSPFTSSLTAKPDQLLHSFDHSSTSATFAISCSNVQSTFQRRCTYRARLRSRQLSSALSALV